MDMRKYLPIIAILGCALIIVGVVAGITLSRSQPQYILPYDYQQARYNQIDWQDAYIEQQIESLESQIAVLRIEIAQAYTGYDYAKMAYLQSKLDSKENELLRLQMSLLR